MNTRGFFVGRFQPFHNGHLQVVNELSTEVNEIVIGIGSPERSHTHKNPLTGGERMDMIHAALEDHPTTIFHVPITDIPSNAKWVAHVTAFSPRFEIVYTNNPLVDQLFTEAGYTVRGMPLYNRTEYQGTEIRRRITANEPWTDLVPDEIATFLTQNKYLERIRAVGIESTERAE